MDKMWILYLSGYIVVFLLKWSNCGQVTLLDTRECNCESLNWVTHSASNTSSALGWREGSYNDNEGHVYRVYFVCHINFANTHNWLRTPYIHTGEAKRLYIEIGFTMRTCKLFQNPDQLKQCKESFRLLYYGADQDISNANRPTWDTNVYNHLDVIAADQTFDDGSNGVINTEVRSVEVSHNGMYFAFYDTGACSTIIYVRIYYIMCPSYTDNFARFPDTQTSADGAQVVQQSGTCVENAAIEGPPKAICISDGKWQYVTGGCKCMPGYEPFNGGKQKCEPCPVGKYKWQTGSERCLACPEHSQATQTGSVECQCIQGYYRNVNDDKSERCTTPPSAPQELKQTFLNQSSVRVEWKSPLDLGGRVDLKYRVEVAGQVQGQVTFTPARKDLEQTNVLISGLHPATEYKIEVFAENGVSSQSSVQRSLHVYVTTEPALPPRVSGVRFTTINPKVISLAWDPPDGYQGDIEKYEVTHYAKGDSQNATKNVTTLQSISFKNLRPSTEYYFKIRAKTSKGWGEYSKLVYATTGSAVDGSTDTVTKMNEAPNSDSNLGIIIGSAVAVIICMLIVVIMVLFFIRRNNGQCNEKGITECDTLAYGNVQCQHLVEGSPALSNGILTMPLFTAPGGHKTYIDPHTYEDPNQAVREFTKEIDASYITIESVIGGGEFGDVCKGRLKTTSQRNNDITVAIKTLKAGASDKNRLDFLTEASIMGQFDDPNVIYLEGVVTKSTPNMIVMEFMENGALDAFLRNNDGKFTVLQLVGMMRGISSGMRYLSEMQYIHRDLAARNILVSENLVCKVADFGLSREVESDDTSGAYTTKGGKIPVRWTAPEAIAYRKFTTAADVWSYGVVMWEVMSYGERPYWNWSNQDVIKAVDKGFRLPPPMDCPEPLYQLMIDCWHKERNQRPKFSAIVKSLDKLIRSPEMLRNIAQQRPHQFINPNKPDLTSYASVEDWLTSIKMERYIENFVRRGITGMEQVAYIKAQDLVQVLGVTLVGHQKKIMNSVQTLRAHMFMPQDNSMSPPPQHNHHLNNHLHQQPQQPHPLTPSAPIHAKGVTSTPQGNVLTLSPPHAGEDAQVSNGFVV